jgi:exonuclease III
MEEVAGSGVVRVATLNLWGRHGAWDERRSVLVDGLRELRPDIIAFQEAVVTDGYDQVAHLLGAEYHVAHQAGREADGTGLSIACRWPLGEVREEALHLTPRVDPNRIAVAEVLAPAPSERCCSPTTTPRGSWASSTNASCRPWRPRASSRSWWASGT